MDKFIYYIGVAHVLLASIIAFGYMYWKLLDWFFKTMKYTIDILHWAVYKKEFKEWFNKYKSKKNESN